MTGTSDSLFDQFYKVSTVNQRHNVFISMGKYIISVQRVWLNKERHWALENCLQFFLHLISDNIFWGCFLVIKKREDFLFICYIKIILCSFTFTQKQFANTGTWIMGAVYLYRELLRSSINNMETPSNPFALWLQRCLGI